MSSAAPSYGLFRRALALLAAEADRRVVWGGLAAALAVALGGALSALAPVALKGLVDAISVPRQSDSPSQLWSALAQGGEYLGVLIAARLLTDVQPLLSGAVDQRLHRRLMQRFFSHVLRLPMAYLVKRRIGELQHTLDLASAGAQLMTGHLIGSLLPVAIELITMTTVLVHLRQPGLVAVFASTALAYLVIFSAGARAMNRSAKEVSTSSMALYAHLGEGLAHLETLRCFNGEQQARIRIGGAGVELERRWMRLNRLNVLIALAASATFAISMAASLLIAATAIGRHALSIGGFVLATVYMLQMVRPLESLGAATRDLSRAVGHFRPLLALLAEPLADDCTPDATHRPAATARRELAPSLRIEDLHFGYDPGRSVLKGIDLDVPAGSTTAIVGRSGSGKSSLARLLLRLYAPQKGRILLDGRPIDSIDVAELRGTLIGLVPQETALLHESIAMNIALGSTVASHAEIHQAAIRAQLGELIDTLPQGLHTPVGDRGMALSGGERQRVGIARALLRRPGLYVLDEPTSMLDSRTEGEIQEALRAIAAGTTTLVIAHRLSTIAHADQIVVLDEGRVRERGTHRSLMALDGLYAHMWRQQVAGRDG